MCACAVNDEMSGHRTGAFVTCVLAMWRPHSSGASSSSAMYRNVMRDDSVLSSLSRSVLSSFSSLTLTAAVYSDPSPRAATMNTTHSGRYTADLHWFSLVCHHKYLNILHSVALTALKRTVHPKKNSVHGPH